jgi:ribosomal protein S18 acetylase RimI-like enzyme
VKGAKLRLLQYANENDKEELFTVFIDWDKNYSFDYDVFSKTFDEIFKSNTNWILLSKENNNIIGFVQIMYRIELGLEPYYEIVEFLVKETERSKGVGHELLIEVEKIAQKNKVKEIKLSSQVHRSRAHVFYEVNGYQYCKISKFYEKKI